MFIKLSSSKKKKKKPYAQKHEKIEPKSNCFKPAIKIKILKSVAEKNAM